MHYVSTAERQIIKFSSSLSIMIKAEGQLRNGMLRLYHK